MTILTSGYVDLAIGTATRSTLAPSTAAFVQYETQATVMVQARAKVAGYTVSSNSTNDHVKLLVLGQWYLHALGFKKGVELPPLIAQQVTDLNSVAKGDLPIAGLDPDSEDAIGGVEFSTSTDRPTSFGQSDLELL